ncbi:MAG TPA: O-antigen ligase family protein [Anaeromyxobacteraceae bacterium]|nr:O-antigen ligase family protein [Anaeromyxobacteraceae bacterium]
MTVITRVLCLLLLAAWTAEGSSDKVVYSGHWHSLFESLSPLFEALPGVNLSVWQASLLVLVPVCLVWPGAWRGRPGAMDAAILASLGSVAVTFIWGWLCGGAAYSAYFQLWRFLSSLLVGVLLLSAIRTPRDLKALGLTVLVAALIRGTLVIYFYWAHVRGRIEPPPAYMTTHDDSLLFVAGLLVSLSWAMMQGTLKKWFVVILVWSHLLYAVTLNNRRLAWIELLLALVVMYALLPSSPLRRRATRAVLVAAPVLVTYVALGGSRTEPIFAPARALSTSGSDEDASSLARLEEMKNLLYTLSAAGNPILGTGWGRPYLKVTSVYANFGPEWWLYLYTPHNSLLGVAVFGGLVGVCGIWLVVPVAAFLAARGYRGGVGAIHRAAALAALGVLPAYGVQCYGDIGFQSLTCNLILGVAVATAGRAAAWVPARRDREGPSRRPDLAADRA